MSGQQLANLQARDPLLELDRADDDVTKQLGPDQSGGVDSGEVHIRVQQRNGRKCITTLQGLNPRVNFDKLNKHFKKLWGCSGIIVDDKTAGKVIQLQGDQRGHLQEFLVAEKLAKEENLRIYGL